LTWVNVDKGLPRGVFARVFVVDDDDDDGHWDSRDGRPRGQERHDGRDEEEKGDGESRTRRRLSKASPSHIVHCQQAETSKVLQIVASPRINTDNFDAA
jgi:hypothetical protein